MRLPSGLKAFGGQTQRQLTEVFRLSRWGVPCFLRPKSHCPCRHLSYASESILLTWVLAKAQTDRERLVAQQRRRSGGNEGLAMACLLKDSKSATNAAIGLVEPAQ